VAALVTLPSLPLPPLYLHEACVVLVTPRVNLYLAAPSYQHVRTSEVNQILLLCRDISLKVTVEEMRLFVNKFTAILRTLLTILLTISFKNSPSSEAKNHSASQEIPRLL
jgi:hypothetical protein